MKKKKYKDKKIPIIQYIFPILIILSCLAKLDSIQKKGYYVEPRGDYLVEGFGIAKPLYSLITISSMVIIYYLLKTIYILIFIKKEDRIDNFPPPYVTCVKCKKTYDSYKIHDLTCTECGGDLEDLKGFYERHPELK
ncbi:hypothetical protein JCM14469_26870 [Desulfatiferula olefinivorans]